MPLRRYGRAERPVLVSADGRSPSLGLSPMSPQRGQGTTEPSTGGLPAATFGVPPDAADRGDGPMLGDWDFSASTTSQKPVPGSQSSAPPKDGKTSSSASGARSQGGPGEGAGRQWKQAATAESQDEPEVKVSAAFIGQHGQARAKVDDIEFVLSGLDSSLSSEVRTTSFLALAKMCRDQEMRALLRAHAMLDKVLAQLASVSETAGAGSLAAALALLLLSLDEANTVMQGEAACRILVQSMQLRLEPAAAGGCEEPAKAVPKFKRRRMEEEAKASLGAVSKVLDLCQEAKDVLKLPDELQDWAEASRLVSHEHLIVQAATHLAQRHSHFRDNFRLAGGVLASCSNAIESLLGVSLGEGNNSSSKGKGPAQGVVGMWRLTRDLHLLESITFMSEANQQLVLEEQPTMLASLISLVSSLTKALTKPEKKGGEMDSARRAGCRLAALKVMVNLTNHSSLGARQFGEGGGVPVLVELLGSCSATGPSGASLPKPGASRPEAGASLPEAGSSASQAGPSVPEAGPSGTEAGAAGTEAGASTLGEKAGEMESYDALTLGLGLLINVVESNGSNCAELVSAAVSKGESALQFLVRIFLARVTTIEGKIDFKDIKIDQLVVAAYSSVLIGCAIKDRPCSVQEVEGALGDLSLSPLVQVLDYFIQCHEEADRGRTATQEFLSSLAAVLSTLGNLLNDQRDTSTTNDQRDTQ